ncbi:TonB-dependent receptor [Granulicella sp. L56]|nr:carboxypeptidase regulatory-like domain-containing protein [Granulicella sp. L56]
MNLKSNASAAKFRFLAFIAIVIIGFLLNSFNANAQLSSAAVNGTVRDTTGAVIEGAKVSLREVSTGRERTAESNSTGNYAFVDVAPGTYVLEVAKPGFSVAKQSTFALHVNQTAAFNFSLAVGSQVQQVTVEAASAQLETSTANLGTVINGTAVNSLPLNGRNFTQLLTLTPGSSRADTGQGSGGGNAILIGSFGFPAVNGQMNRSNLFLLDGITDQQFWFSEYAVPPIVDSIDEFKVQSHNDQSQFGGVMGGIVNVVTKSGSNQFHGDAWEFLRNDAFDASNPLLASKTPLKQSVYGVTIGGPVLFPHYYNGRNRTFFFGAYEGSNINSASEKLYNVPTQAELNGDFSAIGQQLYNPYTTTADPNKPGSYLRTPFANNNISSAIDPTMLALVKQMYPAPVPLVSGFNGVDTTPTLTRQNNYSLRLDHEITQSNLIWARLSQFHATQTGSGGFQGLVSDNISDGQNWGVGYLHTFGPSATLQLSAGHVWQNFATATAFTGSVSADGFNQFFACGYLGPLPCQIPVIAVTGYAGGGPSYLNDNDGDIYEWKGDFTKLAGHHTWQFGASISRNDESVLNANGNLGFSAFQTSNLENQTNTGNALASFLIGAPTTGERRNNLKLPKGGWVNAVYVGDQWKLTSRLTLNIGLRYDWDIMPTLAPNSTQSNLTGALNLRNGTYILTKATAGLGSCAELKAAPCIPGGTLPAHVIQGTSNRLINNQVDNIQPRLGLAYQIDSRRVLHLSYARVYDDWSGIMQMTQNEGALWPSFGLDITNNLNSTNITTTAENPLNLPEGQTHTLPNDTPFTQSANFIAPYLKNPYSDQWNVGVQQQLGPKTALTLNYVGSRSTHLPCCGYFNVAVTPGPGTPQSRAPFPYITPTQYEQSNGSSSYNALQVQVDRKMSSGLAYTINYTWSKTIDVACDGYFGAEGCFIRNPYDPAADRSVAGFDLPQMVTASLTYLLPFGSGQRFQTGNRITDTIVGGWQVNAITTLTSGTPYTVSYSGDVANTGNTYQGVNLVGIPHLANPSVAKWFNTAAFQAPAQYTYGDLGRNTMRSDWYRDVDLSVFRRFAIKQTQTEFRAEAFNLTNTPVWGTPTATLNSTTFGKVSGTASTQRELQLALKISF